MKNLFKFLAACFCVAALATGCKDSDPGYEYHYGEMFVKGIEAVSLNNEGAAPVVAVGPVKKEAFMIGVRFLVEDSDPDGDQYIENGVHSRYYRPYGVYRARFYTVNDFNDKNPAGSNVTQYFCYTRFHPSDVDEGYLLMVSPKPGQHAFRVVYTDAYDEQKTFECTTPMVELK